ncbi:hypothetical protein TanjilG_14453 [Lupinus angustifolius]|uniref:Uncharacterized protein n=1 Tax=Lupinus angustifolius TaxID=3871 RepID=A0A1J7I3W7_LUPAN|nr:hypothetical protein TanjilG_14453 [Lupinus angustifolius]
MEKINLEIKAEEGHDEMKWVHDSSVDYKGRVPLRASTGSWKASIFIVGVLKV